MQRPWAPRAAASAAGVPMGGGSAPGSAAALQQHGLSSVPQPLATGTASASASPFSAALAGVTALQATSIIPCLQGLQWRGTCTTEKAPQSQEARLSGSKRPAATPFPIFAELLQEMAVHEEQESQLQQGQLPFLRSDTQSQSLRLSDATPGSLTKAGPQTLVDELQRTAASLASTDTEWAASFASRSPSPSAVLSSIELLCACLIEQLTAGHDPASAATALLATLPTGSSTHSADGAAEGEGEGAAGAGGASRTLQPLCSASGSDWQLSLQGLSDLSKLLRVLRTSYALLLSSRTASQRELYYLHASYWAGGQLEANAAIGRAAGLLGVPRHGLGLLAASRGWVHGLLWVRQEGRAVGGRGGAVMGGGTGEDEEQDESSWTGRAGKGSSRKKRPSPSSLRSSGWQLLSEGAAMPIPADSVCKQQQLQVDEACEFILVVEKECIFRRLSEDAVWSQGEKEGRAADEAPADYDSDSEDLAGPSKGCSLPCIIITGCGFPDTATRAFLWQLCAQRPSLPVYGLSDWNPYGLAIMQCYRQGAKTGGGRSRPSGRREGAGGGRGGGADGAVAADPTAAGAAVAPEGSSPYQFAVPQLQWLGLHSRDIVLHQLPPSALQRMSSLDEKKARALLQQLCGVESRLLVGGEEQEGSEGEEQEEEEEQGPYEGTEALAEELQAMLQLQQKMELEGLLGRGLGYLSRSFLPYKIYEQPEEEACIDW